MSDDIKVFIEIPEGSQVKYELDEETGELMVDRLMPTAMGYPVNYGLIEGTHGEDGDALDALVFISAPVVPGAVIKCKVIGMLEMEDEGGQDAKLLAVPEDKILPIYKHLQKPEDVNELLLAQIQHFFEHYKDLEKGKWVKVKGWTGVAGAHKEILDGIEGYAKSQK